MTATWRNVLVAAAIVVLVSGAAGAGDGCIEISQANAANLTNLVPGGCWILTGNVELDTGLTIDVSCTTLDLNGFNLRVLDGPAVTIGDSVFHLVIRNGVITALDGQGILASGGAFAHHRFQDLQISSDGTGIEYSLNDDTGAALSDVLLERVQIRSYGSGDGVRIALVSPQGHVRNVRITDSQITTGTGIPVVLGNTGPVGGAVEAFQVESSTLTTFTSRAAFAVEMLTLSGGDAGSALFSGAIRNSELSAPEDANGTSVVFFQAGVGALHCSGNTLIAPERSSGSAVAFSTPSAAATAPIVIRNNTSTVPGQGSPVAGTIVSPPLGSNSGNPILSNYDTEKAIYY